MNKYLKHLLIAVILGLIHALLMPFSILVSFIYILGFAFILLKDVKGILQGFIHGLIYIIPGFIIHVSIINFNSYLKDFCEMFHLQNYMFAISAGLILLAVIIGAVNEIKTEKKESDKKIKVDFKHVLHAVIVSVAHLVIIWVCSKFKWPVRGIVFLTLAPSTFVGTLYFLLREVKGFVNGLLHGALYALVGILVISAGLIVFVKIPDISKFYVYFLTFIAWAVSLAVVTGIIGHINAGSELKWMKYLFPAETKELEKN